MTTADKCPDCGCDMFNHCLDDDGDLVVTCDCCHYDMTYAARLVARGFRELQKQLREVKD